MRYVRGACCVYCSTFPMHPVYGIFNNMNYSAQAHVQTQTVTGPFRSTTPVSLLGVGLLHTLYHPSSCKRASASSAAGWPDCTAATRHRLASPPSMGHVRPLCSRCARPHCASASPSSAAWRYWPHARGRSPLRGVHMACVHMACVQRLCSARVAYGRMLKSSTCTCAC